MAEILFWALMTIVLSAFINLIVYNIGYANGEREGFRYSSSNQAHFEEMLHIQAVNRGFGKWVVEAGKPHFEWNELRPIK